MSEVEPIEAPVQRLYLDRRWAGVALLALLVVVLILRRLAWAPDDEMAPSILRGDLLVILPLAPRVGDVVALTDPLEPTRWTLRRVVAGPGQSVRFEDGAFLTSDEPHARKEMGRADGLVTVLDGEHLVRMRTTSTRWLMSPVALDEDHWFLAADAQDEALDSRWWGAAPTASLAGVVVARLGAPQHPWRGWFDTSP